MPPDLLDDHPEFKPRDRMGLWLYALDRDYVTESPFDGRPFHARWLRIAADGRITIPANYAWDGCTPKWSVFDLFTVGTPDGIVNPRTRMRRTGAASLVHDALYQYLAWHDLSRAEVDRLFLEMMRRDGFALALLYWVVVRAFGGLFAKKKHPERARIRAESRLGNLPGARAA